METFEEVLDLATAASRERKENEVRRSGWKAPGSDITPAVSLYEGEKHLCDIAVYGGRDEALEAVCMGWRGLCADRAVFVIDAHMKSLTPEQYENYEFEPGQMQRECHEEEACARGEITDVLIVHVLSAAEGHRQRILPYRLQATEPHVLWDESMDLEARNLSGIVFETLEEVRVGGNVASLMEAQVGMVCPDELRLLFAAFTMEAIAKAQCLLLVNAEAFDMELIQGITEDRTALQVMDKLIGEMR